MNKYHTTVFCGKFSVGYDHVLSFGSGAEKS